MSDVRWIVTVLALVISEALPFVRRHLDLNIPADGILFVVLWLMFKSKCFSDSQLHSIESVVGKDINGDGIVGPPSTPTTPPLTGDPQVT